MIICFVKMLLCYLYSHWRMSTTYHTSASYSLFTFKQEDDEWCNCFYSSSLFHCASYFLFVSRSQVAWWLHTAQRTGSPITQWCVTAVSSQWHRKVSRYEHALLQVACQLLCPFHCKIYYVKFKSIWHCKVIKVRIKQK